MSKSPRKVERIGWVFIGLAVSSLAIAGSLALADSVDPSMPRKLVVGAPRGYAPSERIDAHRLGRTTSALPFPPAEKWQRRLSSGLEVAPIVDAQENIICSLTVPEVVKLGPDGREIWRVRVGAAAALASPVITSDGTIVVLTAAGTAYGITPLGVVRYATPLGVRGRDLDASPLALADGGLVIAAGRSLLELDADGAVRARATVDERAIGGVIAWPEGVIATTEAGDVLSWRPPAAPRKLGSFGGSPRRGAALADARTLIAVVDARSVVALDLPTGTTHVRANAAAVGALFDAPVAVAAGGVALTATYAGVLVGLDATGNEKLHIAIDKPPPAITGDAGPAASFFGGGDLKPSPPVIVDPSGRVGFARASGRVGVVASDGSVGIVNEHLCGSPIAVEPAGNRRMVVGCRDGTVWMIGE
jgi:hypothetical protein